MRNGEGDHYFCLFNWTGALLKGFAQEAPMSPYQLKPPKLWPGVLDQVPAQFSAVLAEPALAFDETTFCIWQTYADTAWQCGNIHYPVGPITDGSAELLAVLDREPLTYQQWAQAYYQQPITLQAITAMYQHEPLTQALITALNPTTSLQELSPDIAEIGYPRPSCSLSIIQIQA
jgi:hypothetical protein